MPPRKEMAGGRVFPQAQLALITMLALQGTGAVKGRCRVGSKIHRKEVIMGRKGKEGTLIPQMALGTTL